MKNRVITKLLIAIVIMFAAFVATGFISNEKAIAAEKIDIDFNKDGLIDVNDSIYLLMSINFPNTYEIPINKDFNHDNLVNINDAIYVLMHIQFPEAYPLEEKKEEAPVYRRQDLYLGVDEKELFVTDTIKELQTALKSLGYKHKDGSEIVIDGHYTESMADILTLFQAVNGDSNPDGNAAAGGWTWRVIDELLLELAQGRYTVPEEVIRYYTPEPEKKPEKQPEPEKEPEKEPEPEIPDLYNGRASIYYGIPSNSYVKDTVKELQVALNKLGFTDNYGDKLNEDGLYGERTYQAVLKLQDKYDLGADGVLSNRGGTWYVIDELLEALAYSTPNMGSYAPGSIANCGKDENNGYHYGQAGDQTGAEYHIIGWYNRPWDYILRYEGERASEVRALIAQYAAAAALNDHIGYDQTDSRYTMWDELVRCGYNPALIINDCEADCSSSTAFIVRAVGYTLGIQKLKDVPAFATFTEGAALTAAGFTMYEGNAYISSGDYLLAGDVLLNVQNHTTICIKDGSKSSSQPSYDYQRVYISKGSSNSTVRELQQALNTLGYTDGNGNSLVVDGIYGDATFAAVCKLQNEYDLGADGILSATGVTWAQIDYMLANGIKAGGSGSSAPSGSWTVKVTTQSDSLNIRSGPGKDYGVIGTASKGSVHTATKESNGWTYLSDLGGWGINDYLSRQ